MEDAVYSAEEADSSEVVKSDLNFPSVNISKDKNEADSLQTDGGGHGSTADEGNRQELDIGEESRRSDNVEEGSKKKEDAETEGDITKSAAGKDENLKSKFFSEVGSKSNVSEVIEIRDIIILLDKNEFEFPESFGLSKPTSRTRKQKKPPEDGEEDSSVISPDKKKKKVTKIIICATCENEIIPGSSALPENSLYCSLSCIRGMVEKCTLCVKKDEKINFIDEQGTLINLPDFQTVFLPTLEEFLIRKPSCKPFVDFAKILSMDDSKSSKYFEDAKGLKKEDTIRSNVKRTIFDQLMARAKKNKVGVSRKATLDLSEQIEVELYRIHKNARNPKYKQWCADFFGQVANESNMFFKSVVSNVYTAKKLVLMKKEEMFLEFTPDQTPAPQAPKPVKNVPQKPVISAVDMILGEEGMDTTSKHNNHEFDSNCKICIAKVKEKQTMMELMARDREELLQDRKRRRELGKQKTKTSPKDFGELESSSGSRKHGFSPTVKSSSMTFDQYDGPSTSRRPRWSPNVMSEHFDDVSDRSFSPRGYSRGKPTTPGNRAITPPPGVSPDRFCVRKLSPGPKADYSKSQWEKPLDHPVGYEELKMNLKNNVKYPIRTPGTNSKYPIKTPGSDPSHSIDDNQYLGRGSRAKRFGKKYSIVDSESWGNESRINNNYFNSGRRNENNDDEFYGNQPESPPIELGPSPTSPSRSFGFEYSSRSFGFETPQSSKTLDFRSPRNEAMSLWATMNPIIWNGQMTGEGFDLRVSLKAISNSASLDLKDKLPPLIPIKARVRIEAMWKFVKEIKHQRKYQTLLYVLEPENGFLEDYLKCYADFERSKRYFVLGFPDNLNIKEAYMFNLEPYQSIPSVFLPLEGPGLPVTEMGKKLICVVAIRRCDLKMILNSPSTSQNSFSSSQLQRTPIQTFSTLRQPDSLDEILEFIEQTNDAGTFLKGVKEFMMNHTLTPEEKTIVQSACNAKIQKQKKQSNRVSSSQPPRVSENKLEEKQVNEDVEMEDCSFQNDRSIQDQHSQFQNVPQEDVIMKERSPRVIDYDDDDDKMEIVEPSDDEEEKTNMNNPSSANSIEAGEVRDSPILQSNNENGRMAFILPPPPPPPTMDLPRPQLDPYYSPMPFGSQQNGSLSFHNDLEDGELRAMSPPLGVPPPMGVPPPLRVRAPVTVGASSRGRGKKNKARRGRGNPVNFAPVAHRFQLPPEEFFPSPQPPRAFPRFGGTPLPPQEIAFIQRPNFRGRPTRPPRIPMGGGPPRPGVPPRGFRGVRPRFPQF